MTMTPSYQVNVAKTLKNNRDDFFTAILDLIVLLIESWEEVVYWLKSKRDKFWILVQFPIFILFLTYTSGFFIVIEIRRIDLATYE